MRASGVAFESNDKSRSAWKHLACEPIALLYRMAQTVQGRVCDLTQIYPKVVLNLWESY